MDHQPSSPNQDAVVVPAAREPDVVNAYLHEISQVSLLSPEEEASLGDTVRAGQEARRRLRQSRFASIAERTRLWRLVANGRRAEQQMVEANLRLVISVARHYSNRGIAFADLVQEGNLGLLKAVKRYNPTMQFRFSTYATYWIRQAIGRVVAEHSRAIRVPAHIAEAMRQLGTASQRLQQKLERTPSLDELVLESGLLSAEDSADITERLAKGRALPETLDKRWQKARERARATLAVMRDPLSLEAPVSEDGDGMLEDVVANPSVSGPGEQVLDQIFRDTLAQTLNILSQREQWVLRHRFGLQDAEAMTLERIGEELGITRERVRQIEQRALTKLRGYAQARDLLVFLQE